MAKLWAPSIYISDCCVKKKKIGLPLSGSSQVVNFRMTKYQMVFVISQGVNYISAFEGMPDDIF